jgi:hypothetical protein
VPYTYMEHIDVMGSNCEMYEFYLLFTVYIKYKKLPSIDNFVHLPETLDHMCLFYVKEKIFVSVKNALEP